MLDVKAELDSLCKDQQDELVGQTLLKNDWQYKVTAKELHMGWKRLSPIRKRLRRDLVAHLWKQHGMNLTEIEAATGMNRKTIARVLKPLGYYPERDYDKERQHFLDRSYQDLLSMDPPMMTELDSFIMSQQFGSYLNYAEAKKRVYKAFPELAKHMQGKMTYLTPDRKKELGVGVKGDRTTQARKTFIKGLELDFPGTNARQRGAILDGHPERVHRLRDLDEDEVIKLKEAFDQGCSVTELARKLDTTYSKAAKALKSSGVDLQSKRYQDRIKQRSIANLPDQCKQN